MSEVGILGDQAVTRLVHARGRAVCKRLVHRRQGLGANLPLANRRPGRRQLGRQPRPVEKRQRRLAGDLGVQRHRRLGFGQRLRICRSRARSASPSPILIIKLGQVGPHVAKLFDIADLSNICRDASSADDHVPPSAEIYWRTFAIARSTRALPVRSSSGLFATNASKSRIAVR